MNRRNLDRLVKFIATGIYCWLIVWVWLVLAHAFVTWQAPLFNPASWAAEARFMCAVTLVFAVGVPAAWILSESHR